MHEIFGQISLSNKALSKKKLSPTDGFFGDFYNIYFKRPAKSEIFNIHEDEQVVALCQGIFDINYSNVFTIIINEFKTGEIISNNILYGNFIFLLIDKKNNRSLLLGDNDGLRSWFYSIHNNILYFSSKLYRFHDLNFGHFLPNEQSLFFSLIFGFYPNNQTVFDNVLKLNSLNILEISNGELNQTKRSLDIQQTSVLPIESNITISLYNVFMETLKEQSYNKNKIAVLLGGFDSALVASMLVRLGKEVETFSFSYEDNSFNQAFTHELSNYLGIKHNWILIEPSALKEGLNTYANSFNQPTNWPNYLIQSELLCKKINKQGFELIMTGDGCDGIFMGYPGIYKGAQFYRHYSQIIKPMSTFLVTVLNISFLEKKLGHVYRLIYRILRNVSESESVKYFLMFRIMDETTIAHLFDKKLKEILNSVNSSKIDFIDSIQKHNSISKQAYAGKSNMGPNKAKLSGCMDSSGLKVLSPYMHFKIKQFVKDIPVELLRPQNNSQVKDIGKFVLTKMAEEASLLPADIIYQPKQSAVDAPMDDWYQNELKETALNMMIFSPWIYNKKFFLSLLQPKLSEQLYRKYISSDALTSHALSLIITTVAFFRPHKND